MPRRRPIDVNIHHERWLVSYSDFVTLLFAFFVVMYSISQVSESKYRVLSETLTEAFDQVPLLPESSPQSDPANSQPLLSMDPLQAGQPALSAEPSIITGAAGDGDQEVDSSMAVGEGAFDKTADLPQLSDLFEDEFADLIDDELVQVHSNELWLEIELKSSILFDSAEAQPTRQARSIFADVATLLNGFDNPVQIEGFTDNVPINNRRYPSNWELSAARAASVVKLLVEDGIQPERLAAVGYGEFRPVADNATEEGRAANRRVVLMIARDRPERPNVSSAEQISQAVKPPQKETSSPFPQPAEGEAAAQPSSVANTLATQEVEVTPDVSGDDTGEPEAAGSIKPVETARGGLLFSSDPELPRN